MLYLDTSVLVALYVPEPMSGKVQKRCANRAAAISALSQVEFHSALARRVRMKELPRDDALRVATQFKLHVADGRYRMVSLELSHYHLARDWLATFETPLRTLDALHLAAAFSGNATVLTADRELARAARHFGVECKHIS